MTTRRRTIRRAIALVVAATAAAAILALAVLTTGGAPTSGANFLATSPTAPSTLAAGTLSPPSALTATPVGNNISLGWSASPSAPPDYLVRSFTGTAGGTCPAATARTDIGSTAATTYSDARPPTAGDWTCYEIAAHERSWTSVSGNPVTAIRAGVLATSVTFAVASPCLGSQPGSLDCGDSIRIVFNQDMKPTNFGLDTVCAGAGIGVVIASQAVAGACAAGGATDIGTITGLNLTGNARFLATYTWNNARTLTVQLGLLLSLQAVPMSGTGSLRFSATSPLAAVASNAQICATIACSTQTSGTG